MGRPKRDSRADIIYHVLNRANATMTIFEKDGDYEARYGDEKWSAKKVKQLGLESTVTPRGRPKKKNKGS